MPKDYLKREEERVIEALLFSSPETLTQAKVDLCFNRSSPPSLEKVIPELQKQYDEGERSFTIEKVAGGYRLVTRPEFEPWIRRLHTHSGKMPLSHAALETLSVVAYKGPVSRSEIETIRGVNSAGVLRTLLEKGLVKIKGRAEGPGRPLLYAVTGAFLLNFGLNRLSDLPKLREISELMSAGSMGEAHPPAGRSGDAAD